MIQGPHCITLAGLSAPLAQKLLSCGDIGHQAAAALDQLPGEVIALGSDVDILRDVNAGARLHMLLDGFAVRHRLLADGRRQICGLLVPGDLCDLERLLSFRSGDGVTSLTACRLYVVSRHAVGDIIGSDAGVAKAFLELALRENARLAQWTVCLGLLSARERLAHFFCETYLRLDAIGRSDGDGGCMMLLTQQELSEVLGLSTVHVNRVLQDMRSEGVIRLSRERLTIVNWTRLAAIGHFEPDYLYLQPRAAADRLYA